MLFHTTGQYKDYFLALDLLQISVDFEEPNMYLRSAECRLANWLWLRPKLSSSSSFFSRYCSSPGGIAGVGGGTLELLNHRKDCRGILLPMLRKLHNRWSIAIKVLKLSVKALFSSHKSIRFTFTQFRKVPLTNCLTGDLTIQRYKKGKAHKFHSWRYRLLEELDICTCWGCQIHSWNVHCSLGNKISRFLAKYT